MNYRTRRRKAQSSIVEGTQRATRTIVRKQMDRYSRHAKCPAMAFCFQSELMSISLHGDSSSLLSPKPLLAIIGNSTVSGRETIDKLGSDGCNSHQIHKIPCRIPVSREIRPEARSRLTTSTAGYVHCD